MRLHQLTVTAFGPYRDEQCVDFDELGMDGLFLLHGDTGAGKTTLLDAVAFAVYGSVPGARNDAKRLRCDTAHPDVVTKVCLELTVQGHRLRIERSPEYERPKRRGGGVTKQQAKASLTWLGDVPSGQSAEGLTRIDEVGRTVQRLLGMNVDQFFQVVMLPQGEFARFLRADTAEREKLLEKLFGTHRFADVEQWFSELRRERKRQLDASGQQARELLARVSEVSGTECESGQDQQMWLEELEKRLTTELDEAQSEQARSRRDRESAEATLVHRRELADKVRRVRQAHAELTDLADHQQQRQVWRQELDAAHAAIPVVTVWQASLRAEQECDRAEKELTVASARCTGVDTDLPVSGLRELSSANRERAGALQQMIPEARQQESDRQRFAELAQLITEGEQRESALARQQGELPGQLSAARNAADEARQAEAKLESVRAEAEELGNLVAAARELPAARQRLSDAQARLTTAVDNHQLARDHFQEVRARRLAGMAAELAGALEAGESCPVCGSADHPDPARPVTEAVTAEDEEAAQQEEHRAHQRREEASSDAHNARQRCDRLTELTGDRAEEQLVYDLREVTTRHDELVAKADGIAKWVHEVANLESIVDKVGTALGEVRTGLAAQRAEQANLAETVHEREGRLEQAQGDHASVAEHREYLLEQTTRIERLVNARAAHDDAQRRVAEARKTLEAESTKAGFTNADAALSARRQDDRLAEITEALAEADRRTAAANATLGSPELADVHADTEVALDEAIAAVETSRDAAERAAAVASRAQHRRNAVDELARRLRAAWSELEPARAAFDELDALTDVVNGRGQNARKMSLRSYVLAARLEQVAVVASQRLQRMSEGRYSFVHSDAAGARGTRGGLGLDVLDDYSGKVRPAKTLSGGESFLASLSLALGLADVVAAETGGALLDTLFIDEGFGTLDADTLDLVMNTLDDLRAGGRVVGLVSHVEEMRQRIAVRLYVRKSRNGSTVEVQM